MIKKGFFSTYLNMVLSDKVKNVIIYMIVGIIGIFYFSTIREGHDWGDDFSAYINHAKNIANGVNYKYTGYIYNLFYPSLGPKAYPPIFPFLLSPIYKHYGLNLTFMKIENVIFFLLFLFILYLIFKKEILFKHLAALLAIVGFNPFFWNFKDKIVSDLLFLLFLYLSFLIIIKVYGIGKLQRFNAVYSILAGSLIYLAYGTRNIGSLLIVSLFIYDMIKFRKVSIFFIITTSVFFIFIILQSVFLYTDISYYDQSAVRLKVIFRNLFLYIRSLPNLWDNGYSKIFKNIFFTVFSVFAVIGYTARVKCRITVFEIFSVLYLMLVVIWPANQGARFLMPIMPLYIFYIFTGIENCTVIKKNSTKQLVFGIFIVIIFISYIGKYTTLEYGRIKQGIGKKETIELFDYIKKNTEKNDIFVFQKPRALALYTDRKASVYHCPQDYKELWKYFNDINASYVISGEPFYEDRTYLRLFVEKYKNNLEEVYSNQDFKVYKIKKPLSL